MARNNKSGSKNDFGDASKSQGKPGSRSNQLRWLSPYLDEADRTWLQDNRDNITEFIFGAIDDLPAGYSLSSKFDAHTDRWLTTLICDRVDDPNKGVAVTGRGSSRINSIYTCLYIAGIKLEWEWTAGGDGDIGDFG